jgi:hypothetical protein
LDIVTALDAVWGWYGNRIAMTVNKRTYREENGRIIRGVFLPVVISAARIIGWDNPPFRCVIAHISVYEDGLIDCWKVVDIDGFRELVQSGWIVTGLPEGAHLYLGESIGVHLTATEISPGISADDLVGQVEDEISSLRGEPTTSDLCSEAFLSYLEDPSDVRKARLSAAYDAVPHHLREYLVIAVTREYIESKIRDILGLGDYDG